MLFSTDYNINNPFNNIQVDIQYEMFKPTMKIMYCTQIFYDQIEVPDPLTCYIIMKAPDKRMYYGKYLIIPEKEKNRYVIGQENDLWVLFKIEEGRTIKVCEYDDPQKAIDALTMCNNVGSHMDNHVKIYNILISYINGDIDISTCIIGILSDVIGYKENPKLQELIQLVFKLKQFETSKNKEDINRYIYMLKEAKKNNPHNMTYEYYIDIYEKIFVKTKFFKEEKRMLDSNPHLNLSEYIDKIYEITYPFINLAPYIDEEKE